MDHSWEWKGLRNVHTNFQAMKIAPNCGSYITDGTLQCDTHKNNLIVFVVRHTTV